MQLVRINQLRYRDSNNIIFILLVIAFSILLTACSGVSGTSSNSAGVSQDDTNLFTNFSVNNVQGVNDGKKITVILPHATNLTKLVANFRSAGTRVEVGANEQVSGNSQNDFSRPLKYTVIAKNGAKRDYIVEVSDASSDSKSITQFSINNVQGVISGDIIMVVLPCGASKDNLVATFNTAGQSVSVNGVIQTSGTTANNFNSPVTYTVTAADGSTQNYTVYVQIAQSSQDSITKFSINNSNGVISGNTISVILPYGTDLTQLAPTYTATGVSVKVGSIIQASGQTINNFTNSVNYSVTAQDGSTEIYTVTAAVAASSLDSITQFSISNTPGLINGTQISVVLPYSTNLANLIPIFSTNGNNVIVGNSSQVSGQTSNNFTNPVTYTVIAADGVSQQYTVNVSIAQSTQKSITQFSINNVQGVISGNQISVILPYGTVTSALLNLTPLFTTTGNSIAIGNTEQISGQSTNNFSSPVTYMVTAANGSTTSYVVNVTIAANPAKSITQFSLNNYGGVITNNAISVIVPYGTDTTQLTASYTTSGANVNINGVTQISGQTVNDFSRQVIYMVTAADGTVRNYTVTVTVAESSHKSILQFSIDNVQGVVSGNTISVALPYGTNLSESLVSEFAISGVSAKVGATTQYSSQTANNFSLPVVYTITAADGTTKNYTVTVVTASNSADTMTSFSINNINGVITGNTISVVLPYETPSSDLTSLVAVFTTSGNATRVHSLLQFSGQSSNNFTAPVIYTVTAADGTIRNYTVTVSIVQVDPHKSITSFSINNIQGIINGTNISLTLPYGSSLTDLVATFSATGSYVLVNSTNQVSGQTSNNFITPVTYTVVAADNSTRNYSVKVSVAPSYHKSITSFSIDNVQGSIASNNIVVVLPYGTDLINLVPIFTTTGAGIAVESTIQVSGQTANNFTNPVTYTVMAADGSTRNYIVTVVNATDSQNSITQFSINGIQGIINESAHIVTVTLPSGYVKNLNDLIPVFTTTGNRVTVNGIEQWSGQSSNDFANPLIYTVTAANGDSRDYTVNVSISPSWQNDILSFSIAGSSGIFTGGYLPMISVFPSLYSCSEVASLVATFTTSYGATVSINGVVQNSGVTANDFTNIINYIVTAQNGSTQTYEVQVSATLLDGQPCQ